MNEIREDFNTGDITAVFLGTSFDVADACAYIAAAQAADERVRESVVTNNTFEYCKPHYFFTAKSLVNRFPTSYVFESPDGNFSAESKNYFVFALRCQFVCYKPNNSSKRLVGMMPVIDDWYHCRAIDDEGWPFFLTPPITLFVDPFGWMADNPKERSFIAANTITKSEIDQLFRVKQVNRPVVVKPKTVPDWYTWMTNDELGKVYLDKVKPMLKRSSSSGFVGFDDNLVFYSRVFPSYLCQFRAMAENIQSLRPMFEQTGWQLSTTQDMRTEGQMAKCYVNKLFGESQTSSEIVENRRSTFIDGVPKGFTQIANLEFDADTALRHSNYVLKAQAHIVIQPKRCGIRFRATDLSGLDWPQPMVQGKDLDSMVDEKYVPYLATTLYLYPLHYMYSPLYYLGILPYDRSYYCDSIRQVHVKVPSVELPDAIAPMKEELVYGGSQNKTVTAVVSNKSAKPNNKQAKKATGQDSEGGETEKDDSPESSDVETKSGGTADSEPVEPNEDETQALSNDKKSARASKPAKKLNKAGGSRTEPKSQTTAGE